MSVDNSEMVGEERQDRVRTMLANRLSSVCVIAEAIHRRHNTSAILRSCEAFGVHEVHLITGRFRTSRGAARGAERWLDLHRWPDLATCVAHLRERGFRIVIGDLSKDAYTPDTLPVDGPVAILFGNELNGVSDEARALADGSVIVPMRGLTESLNVSVAAACVLQRVTERRRDVVGGGDLAQDRQDAFFTAWQEREELAKLGVIARVGRSTLSENR
ncbi:MAG: tRNA (guanosine-2'-O-)-methyltransferase [Myxococcota bacterium]